MRVNDSKLTWTKAQKAKPFWLQTRMKYVLIMTSNTPWCKSSRINMHQMPRSKRGTAFRRSFSRSTLTRNKLPSAVQVEGTCRKNPPSWRLIGNMMKDVSGSGIWSQRRSVMKIIARSDSCIHLKPFSKASISFSCTYRKDCVLCFSVIYHLHFILEVKVAC